MNRVIYTAIFNNYDSVKRPMYVNKDSDYYLFVDEETYISQFKSIDGSIYKVVVFKDVENGFMKAKDIKINPEKYLSEYDSSIYVDGSFLQVGDVNYLLNQSKNTYQMCKHPRRDCAYQEATICLNQRLDVPAIIKSQMEKYFEEGFPTQYGLSMGGIIARTHNKKSKKINSLWWKEIVSGSKRDQLSVNYVLWKLREEIGFSDYDGSINSVFELKQHTK